MSFAGEVGKNFGSTIQESLALAKQQQPQREPDFRPDVELGDSMSVSRSRIPSPVQNQFINNLQTVVFSESAAIESRRNAYTSLQRSTDPYAALVLERFHASGLILDEQLQIPTCKYSHTERPASQESLKGKQRLAKFVQKILGN